LRRISENFLSDISGMPMASVYTGEGVNAEAIERNNKL
jgi:hypothetical protein